MNQYNEKRSDKRITHKAPIIVGDIDENYIYRALLVNYCKHGICFKSDVTLNSGTEICIGIESLNLHPSNFSDALKYYQGKIIWGKEISNDMVTYVYGVNINSDIDRRTYHHEISAKKRDSRKHQRKPYPKPVFFTSQNQYYQGVINNISRNGALIESEDNFSIGQMIRLVIPGTKIDKGIMLKAEVVRSSESGVGVKFRSIIKNKTIQFYVQTE